MPWTTPVHTAIALLVSYARDTLRSRTEPFVVNIGRSNARVIALLGFGIVLSVVVFDEVEMRIVGLGDMSWPVGRG